MTLKATGSLIMLQLMLMLMLMRAVALIVGVQKRFYDTRHN
jgi:hypothetical protein